MPPSFGCSSCCSRSTKGARSSGRGNPRAGPKRPLVARYGRRGLARGLAQHLRVRRDRRRRTADSPPEHHLEQAHLEILLELASDKLTRGDNDGALMILDSCHRSRPNDEALIQQIEKIESAFLEQLRAELTESALIPLRIALPDDLPLRDLEPHDRSVLGEGSTATPRCRPSSGPRRCASSRSCADFADLQDRRLIVLEPAPET